MAARLVVLQVVEAPAYVELASKQREREIIIPARRGAILDRSGEPLAISVDTFMVYTDHIHLENARKTAEKLSRVLDEDPVDIERLLQPSFEGDQFEFLARQVTPKVARRIRSMELDGIYMKVEPKRYYPGGRLAAHVLGFADIDGKGLEGIESQYESILQGEPGRLTNEQDPTGELELPQAGSSEQRSVPGRSLFLTLDKELQYFTELTLADAARRYHAEAGSAIIMRPDTGEILALANVPQFDANEPGEFPSEVRRNRALTDVYEPGSAFKIVTAAAALEKHVVTPQTTFTVPDSFDYSDRTFHDSHPHPTEQMTVSEIIQESSNVGTIQVGLRLGGKRLDRAVKKFGFGTETGLDFPGESSGIVLDRKDWTGPTIATIPIGQGIAVTPMQLATAYGTLANHGVEVEPKLLYATLGASGKVEPSSPAATRRVVSRATARKMTKILHRVVEKGTGVEAQIPGYDVAGKTGTAQKPLPGGGYGDSWVASFAGFAPTRHPAIVVLVTLDDPSPIWGGSTAAPTFRTITEYALRHLGIAPTSNAEKAVREIEAEVAEEPAAHD
ncbi:MAG TPA: penicillin-binding transpeptidase domain-containing protein [Actinomycetota bacterium]|nr:penicillin-binding transpeptidase domain-containing protein [Actinomycetota bacterium]